MHADRGRLIVLIGMMGAGKTTVAKATAQRLGWRCVDTDEEIERVTGSTVSEIFATAGEGVFRAREADVVKAVFEEHGAAAQPTVLAVAGGAILDPVNRARLREEGGWVVWLRAAPATLADRLGGASGRPLLTGDPAGQISQLQAERSPLYAGLADETIDVDGLEPDAVVDELVSCWQAHRLADRVGR